MKSKNQPSKIIQLSVPGLRGLQLSPHTGVVAKYLLLDICANQARVSGEQPSIVTRTNVCWDVQCWDINLSELPKNVMPQTIVDAYYINEIQRSGRYMQIARTACLVEVKYRRVHLPDADDEAYAALVRDVLRPDSEWELLCVVHRRNARSLRMLPTTLELSSNYETSNKAKQSFFISAKHRCRTQKTIDLVIPESFAAYGVSFMQQEILRHQQRVINKKAEVDMAKAKTDLVKATRAPVTITPDHMLAVAESIIGTEVSDYFKSACSTYTD